MSFKNKIKQKFLRGSYPKNLKQNLKMSFFFFVKCNFIKNFKILFIFILTTEPSLHPPFYFKRQYFSLGWPQKTLKQRFPQITHYAEHSRVCIVIGPRKNIKLFSLALAAKRTTGLEDVCRRGMLMRNEGERQTQTKL